MGRGSSCFNISTRSVPIVALIVALGKYWDWTTPSDAGFNADINLPIYNIKDFKGYLILHHGQRSGTTLMTGQTDPSQFSFTFRFTNKASGSPWGV